MDNHAHSHDFLNTESLPCYPPTDIIRNSDWGGGGVGGDGDGAGVVRHGSSGGLVSTVAVAPRGSRLGFVVVGEGGGRQH
jgi:hypothetical protein